MDYQYQGKLAAGLRNFAPSAQQDIAKREADYQTGGVQNVLKKGAQEMYNNPIVNTAISMSPLDVGQAAYETGKSLYKGNYGEAALNATGILPLVPAGVGTGLYAAGKMIKNPGSLAGHVSPLDAALYSGKIDKPMHEGLTKWYASGSTPDERDFNMMRSQVREAAAVGQQGW